MSDKHDRATTQATVKNLKPYTKPVLTKGPVVSDVTALVVASVET